MPYGFYYIKEKKKNESVFTAACHTHTHLLLQSAELFFGWAHRSNIQMSVKILHCLHAKNNDNNSNSNFPSLVDCLHVAYDQLRIITSSLIFRAVQQQQQQRLWWDHEPLI